MAISCTLLITLQLVLSPCRDTILRLAASLQEVPKNELSVSLLGSTSDAQPASPPTTPEYSRSVFLGTTLALYVSQFSLALVIPSVKIIWDILGGTFATLISYAIPAAAYLVLTAPEDITPRKALRRTLARLMLYGSLLTCAVCTINTIYGLVVN